MEKDALVKMLNQDLADEHISIIRYLIHAYQEGEDTPLGAMLLSMAREEMWHTDWLGDVLGDLGAEPDMRPGVYPHDPTSNASLLRSYIAWEDNLVVEYARQAELVDDAAIKRVLMQQSIESAVHSKRFARWLEKLGEAAQEPRHFQDSGAFSPRMLERLQSEMTGEYRIVLQHLRDAFVFEDDGKVSAELELAAMRHMKHLSHLAEELAESGHAPQFATSAGLAQSADLAGAVENNLALTREAQARFESLLADEELGEHKTLQIEVEHMVNQEAFLSAQVEELFIGVKAEAAPTAPEEPGEANARDTFTVGSLIKPD